LPASDPPSGWRPGILHSARAAAHESLSAREKGAFAGRSSGWRPGILHSARAAAHESLSAREKGAFAGGQPDENPATELAPSDGLCLEKREDTDMTITIPSPAM